MGIMVAVEEVEAGLLWKMAKVTTNIIIIEVTINRGQDLLLPNIVQSLDLRLHPRRYLVVPPPADAH